MSSSGFSFQDLLSSLGRGLIGAPNFGVGLAQGFANFQQQNDYNNLLSKLTQPGSPGNPVGTGTPTNNFVTADRSGMQPITQPKPAGLLAGTNPGILSLLSSMRPDQGLPLLNTLLTNAVTPHGFKIADTADGPHKLDAITGDDLGRVGPAKLQEFNPTMTYARPDDNTATGGMPPALLVPPKAAPSGNVPRAEDIAPALKQVFPGVVITGMARPQNAAYGAPNSDHKSDHAIDIRPLPNMSFKDFKAKVMQLGLPGLQVLDETDPAIIKKYNATGPNWHIGWSEARAGGTQPTQASAQPDQSPFPGYTVVHQATPAERAMTPAELQQYHAYPGSTINTVTGAVTRATQFNSPMDQTDPQIKVMGGMIAQGMPIPTRNPAMFKAALGAAQQQLHDAGVPDDQIAARLAKAQQDFKGAQASVTNFDQGKLGNQVRSFSVGLSHLDTLQKLTNALGNGDVQGVNALKNIFKTQFGQAAPTNFNAARDIVANEIVKAIVGSGGGVGDREKAQATINAAQSPAQLLGVINTYKQLMAGQLHGLKQQYQVATGRDDFDTRLSPEARALLGGAQPANAGGWSNFRVGK